MKKKILLGSILAVALLLFMPSISAFQQTSIEEGFKQDIKEKKDTFTLDDDVKFPRIYYYLIGSYIIRTFFWMSMVDVYPYRIFIRLMAELNLNRIRIVLELWQMVSDTYGWNWDMDFGVWIFRTK